MSANVSTIPIKRPPVRIKSIALPVEHGSWGILFEPLVAGLLISFSPAALFITLLMVGLFLTRQPLKVFMNDWMAGRNLPQTSLALKFILLFSAIFLVGLLATLMSVSWFSLVPFLFVLPFAFYQIYCDAIRSNRQLIPELTGAITVSSSIAVIALVGGWTVASALALWAIFIARAIPSIIYVRNRLKLEKGKSFSRLAPIAAHIIALITVGALAFYQLIPVLPVAVFAILLGRSIIGLSPYRKRVKAVRIGIWEVIYGLLVVLSLVIGFYFHI